MSVATVLDRPALPMMRMCLAIQRGITTRPLVNAIRAALMAKGLTLQDWSRARGFHRPNVSSALHGHRTDRRSREILAALEKEIGR